MRSSRYQNGDESVLETAQELLQQRQAHKVVPLSNKAAEAPVGPQAAGRRHSDEGCEDDAHWPFVPPGEYIMVFVREKRLKWHWGRSVWVVWMRITVGEHIGTLIPLWINALPDRKRPTRGWKISSVFAVATDRKPPKDLWRRRPGSFLRDCVFRGKVRTVKKDQFGVELPDGAHTSVVHCLIERLAGTPPYLRGGKR